MLARVALEQDSCCSGKSETPLGACNIPWQLDEALDIVGHLWDWDDDVTEWDDLQDEIGDDHCPIGVRIGWYGGGGHFVAITGYDVSDTLVRVHDPSNGGYSWVAYATLKTAYKGKGTWTHSYFTTS
jgi:hypothetical protein